MPSEEPLPGEVAVQTDGRKRPRMTAKSVEDREKREKMGRMFCELDQKLSRNYSSERF